MSRDWTPKELLDAEKFLFPNGDKTWFDCMRNITFKQDGIDVPWVPEDEIEIREKYPILGRLLNGFIDLYVKLSEIKGGLKLLAEQEQEIDTYIKTGRCKNDSLVVQWFEGKLDKNFYYSEYNETLFLEAILDKAAMLHANEEFVVKPQLIPRLPGCAWIDFEDGSGYLKTSAGTRYYCYDRAPYHSENGIEYQETSHSPWDIYWGSFEDFKRDAEIAVQEKHLQNQKLDSKIQAAKDSIDKDGSFTEEQIER